MKFQNPILNFETHHATFLIEIFSNKGTVMTPADKS